MRFVQHICCSLFLLTASLTPVLADMLTLETALATLEENHPDLMYAQAELDVAQAELDIASASQDPTINLEGILRSGRRSTGSKEFASDNSVRLLARKTLYDFGRSSNAKKAAQLELSARGGDLITALEVRRIEIMQRYFDVLLADFQYTVDSELMSVYYVSFDQGKDRLERGQISNLELIKLESRYLDSLEQRNVSAERRHLTRALLANAMNRPGDMPVELEDPELAGNQRLLPDYEILRNVLLDNNPRLKAQRDMLAASGKRLESLRAETGPTLDAELQASDYSRTTALRDNLSAGLILSWPLYQGDKTDSRISLEMAQFNKLQASTEKLKMELTQALLEASLEINQLKNSARNAARKYVDFRDIELERSRGLYELELKSNLGTAMVGTVEAKMRVRKIEYQLALRFARLEALLGKPLIEIENTKGNGE